MAIALNDNIEVNGPKPIDGRKGKSVGAAFYPYVDVAEANSLIPIAYRHIGQTVYIGDSISALEYWYQGGVADINLVLKQAGGSGTFFKMDWPIWTIDEEFISVNNNGAGPFFNVNVANNSGGVYADAEENTGLKGVLYLQNFGNIAALSSISSRNIKIPLAASATYTSEYSKFAISALNNGTDSINYLVGYSNNLGTNATETDAIAVICNTTDTFWKCITKAAGTTTSTTTTVAVAANTPIDIKIEANLTTVIFTINGTVVATHTTNIPTATVNFGVSTKRTLGTTFMYASLNRFKFN